MDPSVQFQSYQTHILLNIKQHEEEYEKLHAKYAGIVADTKAEGVFLQYKGFWFLEPHLKAVLTSQDHFLSQPTDILLTSYPKTGTTWLKALIFTTAYRRSFSAKSAQHPLRENNPHDLVFDIDSHLDVEFDASFPHPRLLSTHMPYTVLPESVKASGCKIVYVSRNPKDTCVSLWHFFRNWLPDQKMEDIFKSFLKGVTLYGPYWDHVLEYWKEAEKNPETVLFLKYEELQVEPRLQLKRLAAFMGCPFSEDEEKNGVVEDIVNLCSFNNLTSVEVNKTGVAPFGLRMAYNTFFRKGTVGDSKNYLTDDMIRIFDDVTQQRFQDSGLTF